MSILLTALSLAAAPVAAHQVSVEHGGASTPVTYQAYLDVRHKQVGFAPAGRPSIAGVRCNWTATVKIHRSVGGEAGRVVSSDRELSGTRPGDCVTNRGAIAKALDARQPEVREHLVATAQHDRNLLLAELGAAGGTQRLR